MKKFIYALYGANVQNQMQSGEVYENLEYPKNERGYGDQNALTYAFGHTGASKETVDAARRQIRERMQQKGFTHITCYEPTTGILQILTQTYYIESETK